MAHKAVFHVAFHACFHIACVPPRVSLRVDQALISMSRIETITYNSLSRSSNLFSCDKFEHFFQKNYLSHHTEKIKMYSAE